jgi:NAD(P)-dependent dehydrogenase (short-subunit alcohol dehydrogenase family)
MQYSPLTSLDGRVAVITGGARGIGFETTKAFLENGAKVVIVDIDLENGNATSKNLDVEFIHGDVTDSKFVAKVATGVKERYGRIDVAFNNAGIECRRRALDWRVPRIAAVDPDEISKIAGRRK